MKRSMIVAMSVVAVLFIADGVRADMFGTGGNQFTMDFVPIFGDASAANGTNISRVEEGQSGYLAFSDPGHNYRMGTYEVTNDQWSKFIASVGVTVTGSPASAYDGLDSNGNTFVPWAGTNIPVTGVSWYEAAQFVNWLNTSTGHHAAYTFTGTQGESDYTLATWTEAEATPGTRLFRHKDAMYYLPTEQEWVKAAYWNGTAIQTYATVGERDPATHAGWNYGQHDTITGPWAVGSGSAGT